MNILFLCLFMPTKYNVHCERVSGSLWTSVIVVGLCQSSIRLSKFLFPCAPPCGIQVLHKSVSVVTVLNQSSCKPGTMTSRKINLVRSTLPQPSYYTVELIQIFIPFCSNIARRTKVRAIMQPLSGVDSWITVTFHVQEFLRLLSNCHFSLDVQ